MKNFAILTWPMPVLMPVLILAKVRVVAKVKAYCGMCSADNILCIGQTARSRAVGELGDRLEIYRSPSELGDR